MSYMFMGVKVEDDEKVVNTIDQDLFDMVGGSIEDFSVAPDYHKYRCAYNERDRVWVIIKKND